MIALMNSITCHSPGRAGGRPRGVAPTRRGGATKSTGACTSSPESPASRTRRQTRACAGLFGARCTRALMKQKLGDKEFAVRFRLPPVLAAARGLTRIKATTSTGMPARID